MIEFVELFVVGIGVGAFGALVGIGGGMIMVPLFMLTMMAPNGSTFENVQQVIGTSLFGVLLNALSGTWAYIRQHKVMFRAAVPFALATVPGAFMGSYITDYFTGNSFSLIFGSALCILAILMYSKSKSKKANVSSVNFSVETAHFNVLLGVALSFIVGFLSSILGIGGGVIHVPMMVFILGFPAHIAVATSTFILMVSSCVGVISHAALNHIVWIPAIAVRCYGWRTNRRSLIKEKPPSHHHRFTFLCDVYFGRPIYLSRAFLSTSWLEASLHWAITPKLSLGCFVCRQPMPPHLRFPNKSQSESGL